MASLWWYVARSAGIVAWFLAAASVMWGLLLSTKVLGRSARPNWLLDLHRFLGGLTVVFVAVHLLGLVMDPFVEFGAREILIPFTSSWNPLAVSWGIVAMYLLAAVELTSLLRKRIPKRWWRGIHMSSYAIYAFGTVHLLTAGTDRHSSILIGSVVVTTIVVGALTLHRVFLPSKPTRTTSDTIRDHQPIG